MTKTEPKRPVWGDKDTACSDALKGVDGIPWAWEPKYQDELGAPTPYLNTYPVTLADVATIACQ